MTGIILRGFENDTFSIIKFYNARANRIIPALAVLLLAMMVFGFFYLYLYNFEILLTHVKSSFLFFSNFLYWQEAGYFDTSSDYKWLLHTWSLSVEWQFYIIYPLVLVILKHFYSLKTIKILLIIGTEVGFLFCIVSTNLWPSTAFYNLHARAWEMLLVGLAYAYPFTIQDKYKKAIEWLGLSLIAGSYLFINNEFSWPGYMAIFPVAGAFLHIQTNNSKKSILSNVIFRD